MEKLKPILKQRYWICFGLALIFVLAGWWNASSNLAAKISERKKSVEDSFTEAKKGESEPNNLWVAAASRINEEDADAYKTASLKLWKRQQGARDWPEQIRSQMQKIDYFSEINSKETRERWASIYEKQIEDLLNIVQPFQPATGKGLILVDSSRITRQPPGKWRVNLPTSNEIWSNQEDIWLLKALLTSISKANDSATRITESQVREIKRLTLQGGDRNTKPMAIAGQSGASGGMGGFGTNNRRIEDVDDDRGSAGGGIAAGGPPGAHSHPGSAFTGNPGGDILIEEFGGGAGGGGAGGFGANNLRIRDVDDDRQAGGSAVAAPEVRYVDGGDKDIGYKTRAFLLDVVIRDERLPDLLARLTNSDFPVEIVRVEIISNSASGALISGGSRGNVDDEEGGGFGGGGRGFGGGGGGFGGGGRGLGGGGGGFGGGGGVGFGGGGGAYGGDSRRRDRDIDSDEGLGGAGSLAANAIAADATAALNAAMSDPLLLEVHIGGLLTLYMTPEETEMQAKTEESDAKESAAAPPAETGVSGSEGANIDAEAPSTGVEPDDAPPEPSANELPTDTGTPDNPGSSEKTDTPKAEDSADEEPESIETTSPQ